MQNLQVFHPVYSASVFLRWVYFTFSFVEKKETPLFNSSTEEAFQGEIN